ncbi:MAG: hypothetical protein ACPIG6_06295 [Akkermansiaceae bacterium]
METIKYPKVHSDKWVGEHLATHLLDENCYDSLVESDTDGYCAETGELIFKFRKSVIPKTVARRAADVLFKHKFSSDNRGTAGGDINENIAKGSVDDRLKKAIKNQNIGEASGVQYRQKKLDGTISKARRANDISSGIIGYYDRYPRIPYCRLTAFNQNHFKDWKEVYPIIKFVDNQFAQLVPDKYELQRAEADATSQDFVIPNTAFTTVTVNQNWQTAVHKDAGDFEQGFGNLVALRRGKYEGGYFVLPEWRVAIDLQNCDLLMVNVHRWHGNTPIKMISKDALRVSLVMYYRKKMIECGTHEEERLRAANAAGKLQN